MNILVNNVADPFNARKLAAAAIKEKIADNVLFVEDHIQNALAVCGLTVADLGRVRNFMNWPLVMLTVTDADFVVHFGADIKLDRACDWISPAVTLMSADSPYLAANPSWSKERKEEEDESFDRIEDFFVGHGFSDQLFLVRRSILAGPVYHFRHPSGGRYPMAAIGDVFEQRVDAFMRCEGWQRLTYDPCRYEHGGVLGASHVKPALLQRLFRKTRSLLRV